MDRRLRSSGHLDRITEILIADERDPSSAGMLLAAEHNIKLAPFFVVEDEKGTRTYTVYLKFLRNELEAGASKSIEDVEDTLRANPDLDNV